MRRLQIHIEHSGNAVFNRQSLGLLGAALLFHGRLHLRLAQLVARHVDDRRQLDLCDLTGLAGDGVGDDAVFIHLDRILILFILFILLILIDQ